MNNQDPEENIEPEVEEFVPEDGEGNLESAVVKLKKVREELKQCQQEKQEYLAMAQRLKADYLNFRRETEANQGEKIKFANELLLRELLELVDSFELAFANKVAWQAVDENWRVGVEYIYTKLLNTLKQFGLSEIAATDDHEPFDPLKHYALELVETDQPELINRVVEVVQKGYSLNGRVVRPAKVKVGAEIKK
ncbi:MAG: nucleotide exchange factor GrpE [Patescibacteria group bacterium]